MSYIGWTLLLLVLFTAANLFFSVNNITLRIFSRAKLQEAFKAKRKERLADELADNEERLVLTCSLYRFLFNMATLLTLLRAFTIFRGSTDLFAYVTSLLITGLIYSVFGLAIPHSWSKYAGERFLSNSYAPLKIFVLSIWPILILMELTDIVVKRLAGVPEFTPDQLHDEMQEEFLTDLEHHRMEGVVDEQEQEMIENVLELSETTVDEIMTPRTDMVSIEVDSDLDTVLKTIINAGHSRIPVFEDEIDNIVGLLYAKDLLTQIGKDSKEFKLRDEIRQAYFVPETKSLRHLFREFQNEKLHIAIVLDEYGGTAGIVTIEDIIEELVGEITDEYETAAPKPVKQIDQNTYDVDAKAHIDDLNDEYELDLPEEEDYETVGGFVFSHLGYIPKTGEVFEYNGLKFQVISAEARKVKRLRIQRKIQK